MGKPIRIILADDHALIVEGLRRVLEQMPDFRVVATARNGTQLLHLLEEYQADVLVLDLQMSYRGKTILAEIRQRRILVRVVVLTAFIDDTSSQAALEFDVAGIALKSDLPAQTIQAIRQVALGRLSFPRTAQRWLTGQRDYTDERSCVLSPREAEMLAYVAKGYTNPAIASALSISINTVRFHLKNIFAKLAVTNRTEAAAWYIKHYPFE
jgi:DNA-binding NarL/FixJ family response regulator